MPTISKAGIMQTVNVTDIKVKDGVTTEGARAGQKWELVIITGDDGSEFTTFDTKAKEVGVGGVIELEPVLKGGKVNFTKFKIISKGTPVSQASMGARSNGGDSPEKRKSIEDMNLVTNINNAWIAGKIADDDPLITKLRARFNQLGSPIPEPAKTTTPPAEKKDFVPRVPRLVSCSPRQPWLPDAARRTKAPR